MAIRHEKGILPAAFLSGLQDGARTLTRLTGGCVLLTVFRRPRRRFYANRSTCCLGRPLYGVRVLSSRTFDATLRTKLVTGGKKVGPVLQEG